MDSTHWGRVLHGLETLGSQCLSSDIWCFCLVKHIKTPAMLLSRTGNIHEREAVRYLPDCLSAFILRACAEGSPHTACSADVSWTSQPLWGTEAEALTI